MTRGRRLDFAPAVALLIARGEEGATLREIRAAVGGHPDDRTAKERLLEAGCVHAPTASQRWTRWFGPGLKARAAQYAQERNAQQGKRVLGRSRGYSDATRDRVLALIAAAGPRGATASELHASMGYKLTGLQTILAALHRAGAVVRERATGSAEPRAFVYWPATDAPRARAAKALREPRAERPQAPKRDAEAAQAKARDRFLAEPAVIPPGVCYTRAPARPDTRFTVERPTRFFSAMSPGSYLPHDTAIARAYGGGR